MRRLKCGAWRIRRLNGTVECGLIVVAKQLSVVFTAVFAHKKFGIISRGCDESKDFASGGLYCHDSATLTLHKFFAVFLKVEVDAQFQIVACLWLYVVLAVVVMPLNSAHMVANKNFFAFHATKILFIFLFQSHVADIVARVVVVVFFHFFSVHLSDVAKNVGSHGQCIVAHNALNDGESGEAIQFFLYSAVVHLVDVREKHLLTIEILRFPHFFEAFVKFLSGNLKCVAEVHGIERLNVFQNHGQIV